MLDLSEERNHLSLQKSLRLIPKLRKVKRKERHLLALVIVYSNEQKKSGLVPDNYIPIVVYI